MLRKLQPTQWRLRTLVMFLVLILVGIFTVSVAFVASSEREIIWLQVTRIGTDKQLMARAGAKQMEAFFERVETDLRLLSHAAASSEAQQVEEAVDRYGSTPLVSIARTDGNGRLQLSINRERQPVVSGMDLSDREYFRWAEEQANVDGVYLSKPLIARAGPLEGQTVVIVAVPVYVDDLFDGVMFASLGFRSLIEDYVASLTVYEVSDVAVVGSDGTVIFGFLERDVSGRQLSDVINGRNQKESREYERYVEDILSGVNSWAMMELSVESEREREGWIVGFSPIEFGLREWKLLTMASYEEAFGRLERYQSLTQSTLVFSGLATVAIGGLAIVSIRKAQIVWYRRGFEQWQRVKRRVAHKGE